MKNIPCGYTYASRHSFFALWTWCNPTWSISALLYIQFCNFLKYVLVWVSQLSALAVENNLTYIDDHVLIRQTKKMLCTHCWKMLLQLRKCSGFLSMLPSVHGGEHPEIKLMTQKRTVKSLKKLSISNIWEWIYKKRYKIGEKIKLRNEKASRCNSRSWIAVSWNVVVIHTRLADCCLRLDFALCLGVELKPFRTAPVTCGRWIKCRQIWQVLWTPTSCCTGWVWMACICQKWLLSRSTFSYCGLQILVIAIKWSKLCIYRRALLKVLYLVNSYSLHYQPIWRENPGIFMDY